MAWFWIPSVLLFFINVHLAYIGEFLLLLNGKSVLFLYVGFKKAMFWKRIITVQIISYKLLRLWRIKILVSNTQRQIHCQPLKHFLSCKWIFSDKCLYSIWFHSPCLSCAIAAIITTAGSKSPSSGFSLHFFIVF